MATLFLTGLVKNDHGLAVGPIPLVNCQGHTTLGLPALGNVLVDLFHQFCGGLVF